ncbi:Y-family DNA polymerase [Flavobacterium okayamense]|uniref:SOS mutagenesis and repair protein UmuC n=1 Tax=Flavobacterium okayamense TaxID=2830782 RepID=A0ABM7S4U4_9FLAO|nr:Y-family DNA polymerase [Flavobacterium okayamense]BCY28109.1 SOS mutagenesis and repair protein UmuC [Flavobacterium okayamense]
MYALVDCNNFYASCERVFQPYLNGVPIVVLSNNDGCIISRSEEAKQLGIAMGAPEFKVRKELEQNKVKVFSSNYPLYGDMSKRVMTLLGNFTPDVEVYSIDEAFLNFDKVKIDDYTHYGLQIKNQIYKCLSLPICVGIAPTKALSKVANRVAKKFPTQTNGIWVIDTDEKRVKALKWLAVEDIWGIGRRLSKKMKLKNINTAYDFTLLHNEAYIKSVMGVVGIRLRMELLGKPVLETEEISAKKSIAVTRSFEHNISAYDDLKERVLTFATVCSEKLRLQKSSCSTIVLFLQKDRFDKNNQKYHYTRQITLSFPSNASLTINNAVLKMLDDLYEPNSVYKKAGVIVTQLVKDDEIQLNLFEAENPKYRHLMHAIDSCNRKLGSRKIRLASQDLKRTWKMKQNHLSNQYTTKISEVIMVKC